MKKVAFVCYFFAPHNDAGTFRSVRFAERLLAHNYLPEVYSITEDSIKKFGGKLDHTIGVNLSKEIIINQIDDHQKRINQWRKIKLFRIPWTFNHLKYIDACSEWSREVAEQLKVKIENSEFDLVYVSCAPVSAAYEFSKLKEKIDFRLVVDFRDPYTDSYSHFPGKIAWRKARYAERYIVNKCDCLIVNTPEVQKTFVRRYPNFSNKIKVITNGY